MAQTLAMFWLRRFGLVFAVAFLCLLGLQNPLQAGSQADGTGRRERATW